MPEIFEIISSNLLAAILLVLGFGLVTVEIFVPGFGLPGIAGLILLVVGIILAADSVLEAFLILVVLVVLISIVIAIALKSATKGRIARSPLILNEELDKTRGYSSTKDLSAYIGREGVTLSDLRPAGIAEFDGVRLDVVSETAFIAQGTCVTVIEAEGRRLVVRPLPPQTSEPD